MAGDHEVFTYEFPSTIRGFHVYMDIWDPILDEILSCEPEEGNGEDRYAVGIMKQGHIVGHVPREFSKVCTFFMRRGGTISVRITGKRINQGVGLGLEIPGLYIFSSKHKKDITALGTLLKVK
jgi:hypothetical protein